MMFLDTFFSTPFGLLRRVEDYVVHRPQRSVHFVHQSVSCWESAPASRGHAESLSRGNDSELKPSRRARTGGAPSTTRVGKGLSPKDVPVS
jgi:hypothetical protein